jgi:hypothetical protein
VAVGFRQPWRHPDGGANPYANYAADNEPLPPILPRGLGRCTGAASGEHGLKRSSLRDIAVSSEHVNLGGASDRKLRRDLLCFSPFLPHRFLAPPLLFHRGKRGRDSF